MIIAEIMKKLITIPNQNLRVVVDAYPEYKEVYDIEIDTTRQQIILKVKKD